MSFRRKPWTKPSPGLNHPGQAGQAGQAAKKGEKYFNFRLNARAPKAKSNNLRFAPVFDTLTSKANNDSAAKTPKKSLRATGGSAAI